MDDALLTVCRIRGAPVSAVMYESTTPLMATLAERVCPACPPGTFQEREFHKEAECTACDADVIVIHDNGDQTVGTFQDTAGQAGCKPVRSLCEEYASEFDLLQQEWEAASPPLTSDRVCLPTAKCGPGEFAKTSPGRFNDAECAPCPLGTANEGGDGPRLSGVPPPIEL